MKLKVVSSNPSNGGTTFVTKLKTEKTVSLGLLGNKVVTKHYYISAPNQVDADTEIDLDMNLFNIVQHPFELVDEETGETEEIMLDWLHLK